MAQVIPTAHRRDPDPFAEHIGASFGAKRGPADDSGGNRIFRHDEQRAFHAGSLWWLALLRVALASTLFAEPICWLA